MSYEQMLTEQNKYINDCCEVMQDTLHSLFAHYYNNQYDESDKAMIAARSMLMGKISQKVLDITRLSHQLQTDIALFDDLPVKETVCP